MQSKQEQSDVEQQNYSKVMPPSRILHQFSLTKGDPFRKKREITISKKKTINGIFGTSIEPQLVVMTLYKYVNKGAHNQLLMIKGSFGRS